MKTKLCSLLAGVSLLALASAANAGQPLALSDNQMDGVTAGAAATANAAALALGDFLTFTTTQTSPTLSPASRESRSGLPSAEPSLRLLPPLRCSKRLSRPMRIRPLRYPDRSGDISCFG